MELKVGGIDLVKVGKETFKRTAANDLGGMAAELAYRFFLALFPFVIFLAALGGFVARILGITNPADEVMGLLGSSLPSDTASVLRREIESVTQSQDVGLLSIGFLGAIWAASSGFGTVMKGLNRAYEMPETRKFWQRYAIAIGLTLLAGFAVVAAFIILVAGQVFGLALAGELGLRGAAAYAFTWARWPIIVALLMVAMAFVFWAAPNVELPFKLITPGAVMFILVWLASTWLFGLYVSNFASYNVTYGTLGTIVVLQLWLYVTGFLMLLGAEINAVITREMAPQELRPHTEQNREDPTQHTNPGRPNFKQA